MKKTDLMDVYMALKENRHEIILDESLISAAGLSLERMLSLS